MKKFIFFFSLTALLTSFVFSCRSPQDSSALKDPNTLTPEEIADGWQLLFDGKTLDGWKRFNQDTIGPLWSVQDGSILCNGQGLTEGTANIGGSLITTRKFDNFELILDYKVTKGGNSGVLYHVVEAPEFKFDYESGPEFQLMDF